MSKNADLETEIIIAEDAGMGVPAKKEKKRVKKKVKKSSVLAKSKLETLLTEDAE